MPTFGAFRTCEGLSGGGGGVGESMILTPRVLLFHLDLSEQEQSRQQPAPEPLHPPRHPKSK